MSAFILMIWLSAGGGRIPDDLHEVGQYPTEAACIEAGEYWTSGRKGKWGALRNYACIPAPNGKDER